MKNQKGFTLIELIIVIVILGILAVTAAPQFLNFSSDARRSTVEGLEGSVKAAKDIVYGKSLIAGNNQIAKGLCDVDNDPITLDKCIADGFEVSYGYPVAVLSDLTDPATAKTIVDAIQMEDWASAVKDSTASGFVTTLSDTQVAIYPAGLPTADWDATDGDETGCFVLYTEATSTEVATTLAVTDKC